MRHKKLTKVILKRLTPFNVRLRRFHFSYKSAVRFFIRFFLAIVAITFLFRFIPIPCSAYMLQQKIAHLFASDMKYTTRYQWVSIDDIAWPMQLAVIAAEDQNFPTHYGFDFNAIEKAFKYNQKSQRTRGASTISQQTAKNLYLWHGQS